MRQSKQLWSAVTHPQYAGTTVTGSLSFGTRRQPSDPVQHFLGDHCRGPVLVVHQVVFDLCPLKHLRGVGGGVQEPIRVAGLPGADALMQHRKGCQEPDHGDLGARHRLGHPPQQAPGLEHARKDEPVSAGLRKLAHMQARLRWLTRSFPGSSAGMGQHCSIRSRSTSAWGDVRLAQQP